MSRFALVLTLLLAGAPAGAQTTNVSIDRQKLELLRKMSPEQRGELQRRLAELKTLPVLERERLRDNLRKMKSMSPEELKGVRERTTRLTAVEQKEFTELAAGFFKWSQRMGYREGFPRGLFFQWLKSEKPGKVSEIRAMEAGPGSPRVDEFLKLYHEFRNVALARSEAHVRRHACADPEQVASLREISPREFWPRWQELTRTCQARKAQPGPVPQRPLESPKK